MITVSTPPKVVPKLPDPILTKPLTFLHTITDTQHVLPDSKQLIEPALWACRESGIHPSDLEEK
jgi:hypothetical protein